MRFYSLACEDGYARSCYNLALIYDEYGGVAVDKARALQLYGQACDGGIADDCYNSALMFGRGEGVARDTDRAIDNIRRALAIDPTHVKARQALTHLGL